MTNAERYITEIYSALVDAQHILDHAQLVAEDVVCAEIMTSIDVACRETRHAVGKLGSEVRKLLCTGDSIAQIVCDAIVAYEDAYQDAPNDDAEADLKRRIEVANAWLVRTGYEPIQVKLDKEDTPC